MASLRQRNRLNAMRHTQRTALPMFVAAGFDEVTVDDIASEVGMAASTLYRHFETKEAIVLWDEHDLAIDDALEYRLKRQPPFAAIRDAFVETLAGRYDDDLDFQLQRVRYIYATEQLHGAAVEADFKAREELTKALNHFLSRKNRSAAPVLAGAALLALDVALDQWQQNQAKEPLSALLTSAFDQLETISQLS